MANIGITLRSARIQRGLTIDQVAQDTRISARFLEALEAEAFDELPAPVYVRGFLRSYATYLRLDPQVLLEHLDPSLGGGIIRSAPLPDATEASARRSDPFRPAAPLPAPPRPTRPRFVEQDDGTYPEPQSALHQPDPFSARRAESETPLDSGYDSPYRRGRVGGVLVERGAVYNGSTGGSARVAALVAGGLIVLVAFAGIAVALSGGGGGGGDDDDGTLPGSVDTTTARSGTGTIVVGGARTGTATAATTSTATDAPTSTPGAAATASPTSAETTSTTEPTATPPAPTPTPPPPTPTPTATMAPPPPHGANFSECPDFGNGQPNCGSPMTVVCPPPGQGAWFVDYGLDFPVSTYGWPSVVVTTLGQAITAGQGGCS